MEGIELSVSDCVGACVGFSVGFCVGFSVNVSVGNCVVLIVSVCSSVGKAVSGDSVDGFVEGSTGSVGSLSCFVVTGKVVSVMRGVC